MAGFPSHKKNVVYNLLGQVLPMAAGIVSIPAIIKGIGTERFGIISITWMIIGYFSLFDMGLGRALTQSVAAKIGSGKNHEIPAQFWAGILFMAIMAVAGMMLVILSAGPITNLVLKISLELRSECLHALYVLALSIPAVIISSALTGFLSAYHRFDIVNAVRVPMSVAIMTAPLAVLPFTTSLVTIMAVMTCIRVFFCCVYFRYCFMVEPGLLKGIKADRSALGPLLKFGGWLTVSNIVGPIMVNFDRFVIGSTLSVTSVAYYATPYEIITKLWIVPSAVNGVTFPLYAASHNRDPKKFARVFTSSLLAIFFMLYPVILLVVTFAFDGMSLWISSEFALQSFRVLQWLAIGVFLNCLAQVPYTLIQGANCPDITCKLHLLELVLYVPVLFLLLGKAGIEGAALAWLLRTAVDAVLLFAIALRKNPRFRQEMGKVLWFMAVAVLPLLLLAGAEGKYIHYGCMLAASLIFALSIMFLKPYRYLRLNY